MNRDKCIDAACFLVHRLHSHLLHKLVNRKSDGLAVDKCRKNLNLWSTSPANDKKESLSKIEAGDSQIPSASTLSQENSASSHLPPD